MTTNKLGNLSKLIGVALMVLVGVLPANAQFLRTSYFMEGTHYRQQLNPALSPGRGYINIPIIGALNASVSSTSLGYQDIMDIVDDNGDFYKNPDFLKRLKKNNTLNLNLNTEILSAGWYKGKNFWSFNVGLRTDIGANLTKNLFTFLSEMDELEDNWRHSEYNIGGQELHIQAYTEVGLGLSRKINDRLTVGGRAKVLLGIGNMQMKMNKVYMNANLPDDQFIQNLQDPAYLQDHYNTPEKVTELKNQFDAYHAQIGLDVALESSFKGLNLVENEDGYIDDLDFEAKDMGIAGYGFGIDLGASYKILDNLTVSASVLDLGFMSWKKDATKIASASSSGLSIQGSDYTGAINVNDPSTVINAVNKLQQDADDYMERVTGGDVLDYDLLQMKVGDIEKSRKSRLAATLVLGAEYGFFNNKLAVGALSTTRFLQPKAMTELTFSANYRPKNYFNLALSYSMIQSAGKSFGLAVKVGPLFVGTDYMFLGKNSNSVNGFLGFSVPLNKSKVGKKG